MTEQTRLFIVIMLGIISVIVVAGGVVLTSMGFDTPEMIVALGGVSVGALANSLTIKAVNGRSEANGVDDHHG